MASPSLGIVDVTTGQSNKETTINTALQKLENATQRFVSKSAAAGNVTLTNTEYTTNFFFRVTGHTVARDLVIPLELTAGVDAPRCFMVHNQGTSAGVLTVKGASGTTVAIPIGEKAILYSDGVNVELILQSQLAASYRPMDVGFNWLGLMADDVMLSQYVVTTPFTLPINLTGSRAYVDTPPTDGDVVLDIQKNGAGIGTVEYEDTTGNITFTFSGAVSFVAGDVIQIFGPAVADTVGESFSLTLHGTRD